MRISRDASNTAMRHALLSHHPSAETRVSKLVTNYKLRNRNECVGKTALPFAFNILQKKCGVLKICRHLDRPLANGCRSSCKRTVPVSARYSLSKRIFTNGLHKKTRIRVYTRSMAKYEGVCQCATTRRDNHLFRLDHSAPPFRFRQVLCRRSLRIRRVVAVYNLYVAYVRYCQ